MRFRPVFVAALLSVAIAGALAAPGVAGSSPTDATDLSSTDATGLSSTDASTASATWPGGSNPSTRTGASKTVETASVPFDRADPGLVVTIQLRENGDARWHVTHRFDVNGSNETAAFESFATSVVDGDRTIGTEVQTFSRFAAAASEATGRNMSIENAGWQSSTIENGTGELTYSFTWTNFGQAEANRMVIGDAFRSPDGTWLPRLYDGQRLVIRPPPSLTIVGTPPDKGVTERALVWNGYREFAPGYLEVVLEQPTQPTTTATSTAPPTTTTTQQGGWELSPFLLGVGFALLLVLVGAGSYLFARWQTERDDDVDGTPGATASGADDPPTGSSEARSAGDTSGGTASDVAGSSGGGSAVESGAASGDASTAGDAGSASNAGAAGSGAAAGAGSADAAASADSATAADEDEIDETLLSDEERVLRLLEENGGRMKQANIVSETGWSNAKVSQLLSGMAEDEDVKKLRIGRENLITLPNENVADFGNDDQ